MDGGDLLSRGDCWCGKGLNYSVLEILNRFCGAKFALLYLPIWKT